MWKWGKGKATGIIVDVFTEEVQVQIKGSFIKRNATEEKPAYLIEQLNGNKVLKSHTELYMGNL